MKRVTTNTTFEEPAFTVSFADVSAAVTGLTCEMTIDKNDFLAEHFSFILDEAEELSRTPTSDKLSSLLSCSSFLFHLSRSQFFKGNSIAVTIDDCFTDAVIGIGDELSLSTANATKMPLCASSACSLKTTLQIFVSALDFPEFLAVEKSVIRCDGGIIDSTVNTNDFLNLMLFRRQNVNNDINEYSAFLSSQSGRSRFLKSILGKIRRDFDSVFFSSIDRADAYKLGIGKQAKSIMIEPDAGILLFSGFLLELESFEHVTGLVSDSSHQTAIQVRIGSPDVLISELVQSGLVEGLIFHSCFDSVLTGLIAQFYCADKIGISYDFSSDCYLHDNPLKHNLYKYVVLLCSYENKKD